MTPVTVFLWVRIIYISFVAGGIVKSVLIRKNYLILSKYVIGLLVFDNLGNPPNGAWTTMFVGAENEQTECTPVLYFLKYLSVVSHSQIILFYVVLLTGRIEVGRVIVKVLTFWTKSAGNWSTKYKYLGFVLRISWVTI